MEQFNQLQEKNSQVKIFNLYKGLSYWFHIRDFINHCIDQLREIENKKSQLNNPMGRLDDYEENEVMKILCFTEKDLEKLLIIINI